jgi:hypothetical protein
MAKPDNFGTPALTKRRSWQLVVALRRDFEKSTNAAERLKIGRLLSAALLGHAKINDSFYNSVELAEIKRHLGIDK